MGQPNPSLTFRPWQKGDEEALAALANNRKIWRNLTEGFPHPYRIEDAVSWIRYARSRRSGETALAVLVDGQIAGGVGFRRQADLSSRTAVIGYWLGEPYWGRGIATRALMHATHQAFQNFDFVRLEAGVLEWNPASRRVLEKAGYSLEVRHAKRIFKDGQVCDEFLYVLLRDDWNPPGE
ncbi:MAG: GNAT family protein [Myxococcota bacterium]